MSFLAIFLLLVGIILIAIGIVLLVVHRPPEERQWWMWAILVAGSVLFLLGLAIWIFGRSQTTLTSEEPLTTQTTRRVEVEHHVE